MSSSGLDYRELRQAALAAQILEQQQEERDRARGIESQLSEVEQREYSRKIRDSTSDTYTWLTKHTKTFNPHWKEQNLSSPYLPFPDWPYIPVLLEYLEDDEEQVKLIEKSRTMMVTWAIMGYFTLQAQLVPEREIVVQTMTSEKGEQPIDYAKHLWASQPLWLREAFPLTKPIDKQPRNEFRFANGSVLFGIPAGAGKIRSYHPWGYFNDETAFQAEAGVAYDEALSACKKIVLNSTAAAGWYFDFLADAEMTETG
jgi:hypothetical protein